ncbi:hypothetical protein [Salisaeta longa]|uniref:hypothetical protein n=1 Tax=Salisaeta longa TaxID=503170 RepID=UPI0003B6B756|nr:hypothetical protein [Salisaeta longa]
MSEEATGNVDRSWRRWVFGAALVIFLALLLSQVVNPFPNQPYTEVPHGGHTHYVPKDRDPAIPLGDFPTSPPGPNEQITPQGQVVPKR